LQELSKYMSEISGWWKWVWPLSRWRRVWGLWQWKTWQQWQVGWQGSTKNYHN